MISDLNGLNQMLSPKPSAPTSSGGSDQDNYNYYKNMFQSFAGSPTVQKQILSEFYSYNSPEEKQKRSFKNMLNEAMSQQNAPQPQYDDYGMQDQGGGLPPGTPIDNGYGVVAPPGTMGRYDAATGQNRVIAPGTPIDNGYGVVAPPGTMGRYDAATGQNRVITSGTPTPDETEGSFGFGTDKGNLFGEGGLVASQSQPIRQGLINPAAALIQSGGKIIADVIEKASFNAAARAGKIKGAEIQPDGTIYIRGETGNIKEIINGNALEAAFANSENDILKQQKLLVSDEENQDYTSNPGLGGLKSSVGILSYASPTAIPGGVGVLGKALSAGARVAIPAGMFGFGTSRPGEEVDKTLEAAGTGFAFGAGTNLFGQAVKAIKNIPNNKILSSIDSQNQGLAQKYLTKGTDPGLVADRFNNLTNARLNYITENLTGLDQQRALSALSKVTEKTDPFYSTITRQLKAVETTLPKGGFKGNLDKLGKTIEERGIKIIPDKNPTGIQDAASLKQKVVEIVRSEKVGGVGGEGMGNAYKKLSERFEEEIKGKVGKVDGLFDNWIGKLEENGVDINDKSIGSVFDRIVNLTKDPSMGNITGTIKSLDNTLGNAYKAVNTGSRQLSTSEQARMSFRESLSAIVKNDSSVLGDLYKKMSLLHQAAPDVISQYNKGGSFTSPLLLGSLKIPTGNLVNKIEQNVGRSLQGFAGRLPGLPGLPGLPKIPSGLQNFTKNINIVPQLISTLTNNGDQSPISSFEGMPMDTNSQMGMPMNTNSQMGMPMNEGGNTQALNQVLQYGLLNGFIDPATYNALYKQDTTSDILSVTEKKARNSANIALRNLNNMEEIIKNNSEVFNPLNIKGRIQDQLGGIVADPNRAYVKNNLNIQLAQTIRALSGTAASDNERKFLAEQQPNTNDTVEVSLEKLRALQEYAQRESDFYNNL